MCQILGKLDSGDARCQHARDYCKYRSFCVTWFIPVGKMQKKLVLEVEMYAPDKGDVKE